jgi:hypothetical protein
LAGIIRSGKGESPHEFVYHQWNRGYPVLGTVEGNAELKASWAICNRQGYKLHQNGELYYLPSDPAEAKNIAAEHPEIRAGLKKEFERFFRDVTAREYARVPIEIGRADENPVQIDVTWGDPSSERVKVNYRNYNRDTLEGLTASGDSVRWSVDVVRTGTYEVTVAYGCDPLQAGGVARIRIGSASLDLPIQATPGRTVFRSITAGTLKLEVGPSTLELSAVKVPGSEMAVIHDIWLKRL